IDVSLTISPIKDAEGRIIGASTIARDITEKKKIEKKLRNASLYVRNLIEASLDPLVTISPDGKITDVNKGTELVTGVSREKLIGKDFSDYFTEREKARKGYQEVFEKGFVRDYPLAIRHKSGKITEVLYNASVYKNEAGEVEGVFAAARDITQIKRAEEQLRITSLYARNLIEASLDPLVTISLRGKIMDVNKATELVTGISRKELIGSDFSNYFTEPEKARNGYHEVFEKGFVRDYPLAIRHKSGKITDVLYNATVYKNETGEVQGVFAAARDITQQKFAENELRRAHDELEIRVRERTSELMKSLSEKELLIKEVHHRVKNNLQIVSSMFELQSTYMKDKKAIMAFMEGRNRVATMALIHEKLYNSGDLSRIRFAGYIEELTSNIFASYGVNSEKIRLNINVGDVFFDINTAIPCGLIINELVSNSIKHAFTDRSNGEINIELHPENNDKYLLTINDNGRGFPPDLDFKNSDTLGLKLVITLTNQLNGTIELDRTAGTKFTIMFSELKYKER
ncbi:MAG: PAS domain S-box protein, partial [Candidatus Methanoperedens sp.]